MTDPKKDWNESEVARTHELLSGDPNRLESYGELINEFSGLISLLRKSGRSTYSEHTYTFPAMLAHIIAIPEEVNLRFMGETSVDTLENKARLDLISITIGSEPGVPSFLSMDIEYTTGTFHISRSGLESDDDGIEPDWHLSPSKLEAASRVSTAEINKIIASLVNSSQDSDYTQYQDRNLLDSGLFVPLNDALRDKAFHETEVRTYTFLEEPVYLHFVVDNGQTETFMLTYIDEVTKEPYIVESNVQSGMELKFYRDNGPEPKTESFPDASELRRLTEAIKSERLTFIAKQATQEQDLIDNGIASEDALEDSGQDILDQKEAMRLRAVDNMLDKLGFNSPDPGAA